MRLWILILLSFALFLPVPVMMWREGLKEAQAARSAHQCSDGLCRLPASEAFVPAMQQQPFAETQQIEQENAQRRQQGEACEHGGYFEAITGFNNAPSQAGAGTRTGNKLSHHGTDKRQATGNFGTCQN